MAKTFYNDIIISKPIVNERGEESNDKRKRWQVVDIAEKVELKKSNQIVKVLQRVLPSKYYIASIGPGQYKVGSVWHSK